MKPKTNYTKCGRINIAYLVFGSSNRVLVYIPGWISNIDLMWACPSLVQFLKELSKFVRAVLFDKRGIELSDRVSDLSSLEERMDPFMHETQLHFYIPETQEVSIQLID